MITNPISDFLTRIRNAQSARHELVLVPASRLKWAVAAILEREGYVETAKEVTEGAKRFIELRLKYVDKQPWIRSIQCVSTPGRRVYRRAHELPHVLADQGIAIVSTSAGVMTNKAARRRKLGGEVLCEVF